METSLRRKREEIALLEKGSADEDDIIAAKAKYHALSSEYAEFSKAFDLPQQRERINIQRSGGVDVSFGKPLEKVKLDDIIELKPQEISKLIRERKVNISVHEGKQGKHIKGHPNYIDGRSYITIPYEDIQPLVDKYAGTGTLVFNRNGKWNKQEIISSDTIIGYAVNIKSKAETITKCFKIHYSNSGVHIVPKKE